MVRWGKTAKGSRRYRCGECSGTGIRARDDLVEAKRMRLFERWLTGKSTASEAASSAGVTRRTVIRWFEPFWSSPPRPSFRVRSRTLVVDGVSVVKMESVALLAGDPATSSPVGWAFADRERCWAWREFFLSLRRRGANPCCVVGDGQKGLLKAVREVFPRAKVQRCVVHVHRQAMAWLTRNPKTDAGRELRQLVSALLLNPHAAAAGRLAPVAARVGTGVRRLPEGAHVRRARLVAHAPEAAGRQVAAQERRAGPVPLRRRPLGSQDVESRGGRTQQPDQGAAALASWDIKTPASGAGVVVPPFQAEKTNTKCHLAPIKPENTVLVKPMYGPVTFTQDTFLAKKNADLRPALLRKSVYRPATIRVHAFSRNGGGFRRVTDGCSPTAPAPSTSQRRSYSAGPMTNRPVSNSAFSPTGTAAGAPQGT
ncbi:hypothetical protein COY93_03015 [Candidatus Uhrbacteria bacterium CG_4_10_14_0_8_um_filter_58_22]|uniref:Mutator family transposase n=1 Tax=Candidatus Uhrbacteria bacterium CG_4_10_14_0_8_um_filter_58_22 TaxID=1975029 RepID=A0A2M7QAS9_9BACT|nr:MAG: hypothetical protein COY93_03015 [Candidatus Uhrbacteria bacterium CG_4_10_14_0_8_um_filter_58_22]